MGTDRPETTLEMLNRQPCKKAGWILLHEPHDYVSAVSDRDLPIFTKFGKTLCPIPTFDSSLNKSVSSCQTCDIPLNWPIIIPWLKNYLLHRQFVISFHFIFTLFKNLHFLQDLLPLLVSLIIQNLSEKKQCFNVFLGEEYSQKQSRR